MNETPQLLITHIQEEILCFSVLSTWKDLQSCSSKSLLTSTSLYLWLTGKLSIKFSNSQRDCSSWMARNIHVYRQEKYKQYTLKYLPIGTMYRLRLCMWALKNKYHMLNLKLCEGNRKQTSTSHLLLKASLTRPLAFIHANIYINLIFTFAHHIFLSIQKNSHVHNFFSHDYVVCARCLLWYNQAMWDKRLNEVNLV